VRLAIITHTSLTDFKNMPIENFLDVAEEILEFYHERNAEDR